MRQQRTQRISAPAPVPKPRSDVPVIGYALIVDGQAKVHFKTHEQALKAARDLKGRSRCSRSRSMTLRRS
jgi:hypothetical protein